MLFFLIGVSNLELRSDAIENRIKIYDDANKKLQSAVFYLNRSQAYVQVSIHSYNICLTICFFRQLIKLLCVFL